MRTNRDIRLLLDKLDEPANMTLCKRRIPMNEEKITSLFAPFFEEITKAIEDAQLMGAEAFLEGDYDIANEQQERINQIEQFQERVESVQKEIKGLQQQWENLLELSSSPPTGISKTSVPSYKTFMNPLIKALRRLGGSATIRELDEITSEIIGLSSEQCQVMHDPEKSNQTEVEYRLAWTRTYLKKYGVLDNPSRGFWVLTKKGQQLKRVNPDVVIDFVREKRKEQGQESMNTSQTNKPHTLDEDFTFKKPCGFVLNNVQYDDINNWRELYLKVLEELKGKNPKRFSELPLIKDSLFATKESELRAGKKLFPGFYVEVNASANQIISYIKEVLLHFGIDDKEMKINLQEGGDRKNSEEKEFRYKPKSQKQPQETKERLKAGMKTSQKDFFIPILKALVEKGGSAQLNKVLDRVEQLLATKLNKYDLSMLPSSDVIRWRKTAQWARYSMVKKGYLSDNSPRGVWEITAKGRQWLQSQIKKT